MNQQELQKLDDLTLDLNMNLSILNSAVKNFDNDFEVYDLINIMELIYKNSLEMREIFNSSVM